jgi:hypothetical protein
MGTIWWLAFLADYFVQHTTEMAGDNNFAHVILSIIRAIWWMVKNE